MFNNAKQLFFFLTVTFVYVSQAAAAACKPNSAFRPWVRPSNQFHMDTLPPAYPQPSPTTAASEGRSVNTELFSGDDGKQYLTLNAFEEFREQILRENQTQWKKLLRTELKAQQSATQVQALLSKVKKLEQKNKELAKANNELVTGNHKLHALLTAQTAQLAAYTKQSKELSSIITTVPSLMQKFNERQISHQDTIAKHATLLTSLSEASRIAKIRGNLLATLRAQISNLEGILDQHGMLPSKQQTENESSSDESESPIASPRVRFSKDDSANQVQEIPHRLDDPAGKHANAQQAASSSKGAAGVNQNKEINSDEAAMLKSMLAHLTN